MGQPITSVTIVGGGTAGWLSALMIHSAFGRPAPDRAPLKVMLIESPNIPTVGVGEATVPNLAQTLKMCGISEAEFFRTCNASFKLGVEFGRWNTDAKGDFIHYINPFSPVPSLSNMSIAHHFLRYGSGSGKEDFIGSYAPAVPLMMANKGPGQITEKGFKPATGYAYHLDAGKFAGLMRDTCVARGVEHIYDDLVEVEQDERGYISALQLKERGRLPAEFVLDCTGFRGLIINQVMGAEFEDYSRYLGNDRALAVQLPHPDPKTIPPITRATALGAGWSWRVPLFNRVGTGYVFSSAHRSDEEARAEFLEFLGPWAKDAEPRAIPMRVGRTKTPWVKNCVAMGLSGGFIEPLESTAIHMIDTSLRWLTSYFPDSDFDEAPRRRYNRLSEKLYDEVRDFICLHYALSNRTDDPYWEDARRLEVPDSLAENLELWKRALPAHFDLPFAVLFPAGTFQAVLLGKQVYQNGWGDIDAITRRAPDKAAWVKYMADWRARSTAMVKAMPDHRKLLLHLRGEAAEPSFPMAQATVGLPSGRAPKAKLQLPELESASIL